MNENTNSVENVTPVVETVKKTKGPADRRVYASFEEATKEESKPTVKGSRLRSVEYDGTTYFTWGQTVEVSLDNVNRHVGTPFKVSGSLDKKASAPVDKAAIVAATSDEALLAELKARGLKITVRKTKTEEPTVKQPTVEQPATETAAA